MLQNYYVEQWANNFVMHIARLRFGTVVEPHLCPRPSVSLWNQDESAASGRLGLACRARRSVWSALENRRNTCLEFKLRVVEYFDCCDSAIHQSLRGYLQGRHLGRKRFVISGNATCASRPMSATMARTSIRDATLPHRCGRNRPRADAR
jgi:hypothetical protein